MFNTCAVMSRAPPVTERTVSTTELSSRAHRAVTNRTMPEAPTAAGIRERWRRQPRTRAASATETAQTQKITSIRSSAKSAPTPETPARSAVPAQCTAQSVEATTPTRSGSDARVRRPRLIAERAKLVTATERSRGALYLQLDCRMAVIP